MRPLPRRPGLLFREGQLLASTGNLDAAIMCFQRLVGKEERINRRERRDHGEETLHDFTKRKTP
jgi:hypothetical protein